MTSRQVVSNKVGCPCRWQLQIHLRFSCVEEVSLISSRHSALVTRSLSVCASFRLAWEDVCSRKGVEIGNPINGVLSIGFLKISNGFPFLQKSVPKKCFCAMPIHSAFIGLKTKSPYQLRKRTAASGYDTYGRNPMPDNIAGSRSREIPTRLRFMVPAYMMRRCARKLKVWMRRASSSQAQPTIQLCFATATRSPPRSLLHSLCSRDITEYLSRTGHSSSLSSDLSTLAIFDNSQGIVHRKDHNITLPCFNTTELAAPSLSFFSSCLHCSAALS